METIDYFNTIRVGGLPPNHKETEKLFEELREISKKYNVIFVTAEQEKPERIDPPQYRRVDEIGG